MYTIKPGTPVMFRKLSNEYEPLNITTTKPMIFNECDLLKNNLAGTQIEGVFAQSQWDKGGFKAFIVESAYSEDILDKLVVLVHEYFILEG